MRANQEITGGIDGRRESISDSHPTAAARNVRHSLLGYEFDIDSDKWKLSARSKLDAAAMRKAFPGALTEGAIETLAHYAEIASAGTCSLFSNALRRFSKYSLEKEPGAKITTTSLINFRHFNFEKSGNDQVIISSVRPFLRKWSDLGFSGVSDEVIQLIDGWTLKSAPQGEAVNRQGVDEGPLELAEKAALEAGWMSAFESGALSHEELSLCLLLSRSGRRPSQYANLKVGDLDDTRVDDSPKGDSGLPRKMLLLHVPRAKQTDQGWRTEFRSIELIPPLWNALVQQRMTVIERFNKLLDGPGRNLQLSDRSSIFDLLPLWPMWSAMAASFKAIEKLLESNLPDEALLRLNADASSDAWHQSHTAIGNAVRSATAKTQSQNRVGQPLHVNPRRFRYTLGSELVRKGVAPTVAAHLLDHSSIDSLKSYQRSDPDHAIQIDKTMALAMKPLVQMFRGKPVDREADANGGDRPEATRILYNGEGTATCGRDLQCGLDQIPRCCYTCDHFQPWIDGPHESLLEVLLDERQQRYDLLGPSELVGVNDVTIYAVVEVIQRCETRRQELDAENTARRKRKFGARGRAPNAGSTGLDGASA
jgi:integrase